MKNITCDAALSGSEATLHGELDILSLVGVTATGEIPDYEDVSSMERQSSNGRGVNLEVEKTTDDNPGPEQVIAQAVTYGWTQYNRHPNLTPYVPSIFIDGSKFALFVYNPKFDSLFIVDCPLRFIEEGTKKPKDKYSGILTLWLILHYRLFFRKETVYDESYDCRFKKTVNVKAYEELHDYIVCVRGNRDAVKWGPPKLCLWSEERTTKELKRKHLDSD